MFYCVYCGKSFEDHMNFCPYCGKVQPNVQGNQPMQQVSYAPPEPPVYGETVFAPHVNGHNVYSVLADPPLSKPAKTFGNLSFFLGLAGMCAGGLMVILSILLLVIDFNIPFSIEMVSLPLGIAAIVFSVIARKQGNMLSRPKLGRIFGIIALVLTVVSLVLFFLYTRRAVSEFFEDMPDFSL